MPSQFSFSSARLCRVQKLQFGILSPDEVVRHSCFLLYRYCDINVKPAPFVLLLCLIIRGYGRMRMRLLHGVHPQVIRRVVH